MERRTLVPPAFLGSLVLLLGLAVCTLQTAAQSLPQKWEIFAEGGASISQDHFIDSNGAFGTVLNTTHVPTSGRLFTGFRFWFNNHEALEASYSYSPSNIVETSFCEQVNCGGSIEESFARANFFSLNYVRSFRIRSRVRPFLTSGIGLMYIRRLDHNIIFGGHPFTVKNPVYEPDPFTVNLGGGVDVRLNNHWFFRAEYRDWLFEGPRQNDFFSGGATGLTHNQVPSLGLAFRF